MAAGCIVTIHGIGFEQAADDAKHQAGYADALHSALRGELAKLGVTLGDDPERAPRGGPVYVQSHWPPPSGSQERGLARLDRPLVGRESELAHVALVYSGLELLGPQPDVTMQLLGQTLLGAHRYAGPVSVLEMLFKDVLAQVHPGGEATENAGEQRSLLVRPELRAAHQQLLERLHLQPAEGAASDGGLLGVLRALENDVAAYVCRNSLRERLRAFVRRSLLRLSPRADVPALIVNTHSQGTVVGYDVLRDFSADERAKVRLLITAGSPLRKYVDLFSWGTEAGAVFGLPWLNLWDERDPVADPLDPANWQPGQAVTQPPDPQPGDTLFRSPADEQNATFPVRVDDRQVANTQHSPSGALRAHNYWDNEAQVIPQIASAVLDALHNRPPSGQPTAG
ncbi:MAG TPA: hypothetical protein VMV93_10240 [Chloroflexota bacterium]|nr:hypothetical protein [Chloroflexota bacterium]